MATAIVLGAFLVMAAGAVSVLIPLKFLGIKTRRQGLVVLAVGFGAALYGGHLNAERLDREAVSAGYDSAEDRRAATGEGVADPDAWKRIKADRAEAERLKAEAEREKAAAEREKAAAERQARARAEAEAAAKAKAAAEREKAAAEREKAEACRKDLACWGERATVRAHRCKKHVQLFAKNDYEWLDGFLDPAFTHYRWRDIDKGVVTVIGDKVRFQNGLGAWLRMTYECDIDPATNEISDVRVRRGRLQ